MSRTANAQRAARTRRLKRMIAARIAQARHEAFESAIRSAAAENPAGRVGAFERWFRRAWHRAL